MQGQGSIGAYFKIKVMVSFRSFPWKGRDPVSISNCRKRKHIAVVLFFISHIPPPHTHTSASQATLLQPRDLCWPVRLYSLTTARPVPASALHPNLDSRSSTKAEVEESPQVR